MPLRRFAFPLLIAAVAASGSAFASDNDIATITRQSQAFSEASAGGDAAALGKLLDDHVVFMNEDGSVSGKHDIVAGASPPPKGVRNRLVQSDFHVALHGDVAVTSFTDDATFDTYGQVAHDRFRSTEVWLKESGQWKMISSQTVEVPVAPPQVRLSPAVLDQYAGSYELAAGHVMRIERRGDGLVTIGHDDKPVPLLAEARDVMFRQDLPRLRFVFERDAEGRISGFDVMRVGHVMQHFKRV